APTARSSPGRPAWQKVFPVVVHLTAPADARLRSGMSVTTHVLSYYKPRALLVPRTAVRWLAGTPFVSVRRAAGIFEATTVRLGRANETFYETLAGLQLGDEVLI